MSRSARLESFAALQEFRAALVTFGSDVREALSVLDMEVQRSLEDLRQRQAHWIAEERRRRDELARAKAALAQKRWGHAEGRGPGTSEAEMAVKHAERRLREAEEKIETAKRWLMMLPREIAEFEGPARRLGGFLDADLKHGVADLDRRLAALEAYLGAAAPPEERP